MSGVILFFLVTRVSGQSGVTAIADLAGGLICRRSEELAMLALYGKLLKAASEFQDNMQRARRNGQTNGDRLLYAESSQILRVCDQTQLMILNASRSKNRCMSCLAWTTRCK